MALITAHLYDHLSARFETASSKDWKRELLEQAHGNVLEIGAGTGASIPYYSDRVTSLTLTEPDRHMRGIMEKKLSGKGLDKVQVSDGTAEHISAKDGSIDCVVALGVCCCVADLGTAFEEIRRVLKTGGRFIFLEHVAAAQGTATRRWQNRINPIWRFIGGCHLNRDTEAAIIRAGFKMKEIKRETTHKALAVADTTIRGIAEKAQ